MAYDNPIAELYDARQEIMRLRLDLTRTKLDLERKLANVVKERDYARDQVAKLQRERDDHDAEVERLEESNVSLARKLNEERVGRKRDAEDFMRRVKQQEQYFNDKLEAVRQDRDKALAMLNATSYRDRVMAKHGSWAKLEQDRARLAKKVNQLQQQKRKWKRLHAEAVRENTVIFGASKSVQEKAEKFEDALNKCLELIRENEDLKVKLNSMTWARDVLGNENRALRDRLSKPDGVPGPISSTYIKPDPNTTESGRMDSLEARVSRIEKDLGWYE